MIITLTDNISISQNRSKHKYKSHKIGGDILERYLNCQQVADRYNVKLITVWDWIRKKKLPAIKIGKEYRIRVSDLERFEDSRRTVEEKR